MASNEAWDGSASSYSIDQWKRACLIDRGTGDANSKERYALPVREPDGTVNANGVHAAAARINQVQGISAAQRAAAARKLIAMYHQMNETPPDSLMMMANRAAPIDVESRNTLVPVALRSEGSRTIGGYAAVFNRRSQNLGGFVEVVNPSFFNKSRADGWPGAVARYQHDDMYLLGTTRAGTLRLQIDETGLDYSVDLPECRNDTLEMVTRGDVAQSSMAFQVVEQDWSTSDQGYPQRTLVSGRLIDVAPVATPAYQDTTVGLRSLAEFKNIPYEDVQDLAIQDELRKLFVRTDGAAPIKRNERPMDARIALTRTLGKKRRAS